jgi:hypothetical protein
MDDDSTVVKNSDQNSSLSAFQIAVGDSSRKENRVLKKRKDGLVWSGVLEYPANGQTFFLGYWIWLGSAVMVCWRNGIARRILKFAMLIAIEIPFAVQLRLTPLMAPLTVRLSARNGTLVILPETPGPVLARRSIAAASVFWQKCLERLEHIFFKFNIRSGVYIQTYQRPVRLRLLWFM